MDIDLSTTPNHHIDEEWEHPLDEPPFPEAQAGRDLSFVTIAQLRARVAARGPRRWLIRGIWPAGDYGVHAAEPKAQKTWNTTDLAVAVASGTPWLGAFPIDAPGPVVMFVGEGGDGNTLRRIDASAEVRGLNADTLPIDVCTRVPHLSNSHHLLELTERIESARPRLVTLDPLYIAAKGAELTDLYKMGALLEPVQRICQAHDTALWVVTHFNRQNGRGKSRITGAGPAEWGRVLITGAVKSTTTDTDTRASHVLTQLDVIGGEIPDQTLRVHRRIWADNPDDLDSPLHLETTATYAEDEAPDAPTGDDDVKHTPAGRKLLEALAALDRPAPINDLVDWIVDRHGHGLKRETCSRELGKYADAGLVDCTEQDGRFKPKLWFLTPPRDPRDITRDHHTEPSRVTGVITPISDHAHAVTPSHDTDQPDHDHADELPPEDS